MKKVNNVKEMHENAVNPNGHNSNELLKEHVSKFVQLERKIKDLRGQQKDVLRAAKDDGFLKTAIRGAAKDLEMTAEQLQAKQEVDDARAWYTDLCRDLPLFKKAA